MFDFKSSYEVKVRNRKTRLLSQIKPVCECPCLGKDSIESLSEREITVTPIRESTYTQYCNLKSIASEFHTVIANEDNFTFKNTLKPETPNSPPISLEQSTPSAITSQEVKRINLEDLVNISYFMKKKQCDIIKKDPKVDRTNGIFWRYNPCFNHTPNIAKETIPEIWESEPISQLLFTPLKVRFVFGEAFEPLFCRTALYDLSTESRVSEFCEFVIDPKVPSQKRFIFKCDPTPDIYIVIKIMKIYQKDPEKYLSLYNSDRSNIFGDVRKKLDIYRNYFHDFRQDCCWGFRRLFDDYGEIASENSEDAEMTLMTSKFIFCHESMNEPDFISYLVSISKGEKTPKVLFSESYFAFSIRNMNDECYPRKRLNASHLKIKCPKYNIEKIQEIVPEMMSFSASKDVLPNIEFQNTLFVRLSALANKKHKNVVVFIYFRNDDTQSVDEHSECIFVGENQDLQLYRQSPVVFNSRSCAYDCEFKLILPLQMCDKTHLLFRIFKVNNIKSRALKEEVGYSYLKLTNFGKSNLFIENETYELKINETALEDGYLKKVEHTKSSKFNLFAAGKMSLTTAINIHSSVYSSDGFLYHFMSTRIDQCKNRSITSMESQIFQINYDNLVRFLAPILKRLCNFIASDDPNCQKIGFKGIIIVIFRLVKGDKKLVKYNGRKLLKIWAYYFFQNYGGNHLYLNISRLCNNQFEVMENIKSESRCLNGTDAAESAPNTNENFKFLVSLFFWFKCITKSLNLEYACIQKIVKKKEYLSELLDFGRQLILKLHDYSCGYGINLLKKIIRYYVTLIHSMFHIFSVDEVENQVKESIWSFRSDADPVVSEFKKLFLSGYFDNDAYTQIILESKPMEPDDIFNLKKSHCLTYHLIKSCVDEVCKTPPNIEFVEVLKNVLCKHDFDSQLRKNEEVTKVANIYLAFIIEITKHSVPLDKNSNEEGVVFITIVWILRNCERNFFRHWIKNAESGCIKNLFRILNLIIQKFKYIGKDRTNKSETFLSAEMQKEFNMSGGRLSDLKTNIENMISGGANEVSHNSEESGSLNKMNTLKRGQLKAIRVNMFKNSIKSTKGKVQNETQKNLEKMIAAEGKLTEVVYETVFQAVGDLIEILHSAKDFVEGFVDFVLCGLNLAMTTNLFIKHYKLIHFFLQNGSKLFVLLGNEKMNRFLESFFSCILQYANHPNKIIMSKTCFFIYIISRLAFENEGNLQKIENTIIVSLYSKSWVLKLKEHEVNHCCEVIMKTVKYAEADNLPNKDKFLPQLQAIVNTTGSLFKVLGKLTRMNSYGDFCDFSHYEESISDTADTYSNIPIIQLNWIKKLAKHHESLGNNVEMGESLIMMCRIILAFTKKDLESSDVALKHQNEKENVTLYLTNACNAYLKGGFLEYSALKFTKFVVPMFIKRRNWVGLSEIHDKLSKIYSSIASDAKTDSYKRFSSYYMVEFHGRSFGEMQDHKYIYRKHGDIPLEKFCAEMKMKYDVIVQQPVELVAGLRNPEELDKAKAFLGITYLQPVFDEAHDVTKFMKSEYKNEFTFETRFTDKSEKSSSVLSQKKKVYRVKTEKPFPYVATRQKVKSITHVVHSNVRVAIDDVKTRIKKIKEAACPESINFNSIDGLLSGTLSPQVNGGINVYFEQFYNVPGLVLDKEELKCFEEALRRLMVESKNALKVYLGQIERNPSKKRREENLVVFKQFHDSYLAAEKRMNELFSQ